MIYSYDRRPMPRGFREGRNGDLACPHRDVSCCPACAAKHPEIVEIGGQHFWIADEAERREIAALEAKRRKK